jgi:hypothetical protein
MTMGRRLAAADVGLTLVRRAERAAHAGRIWVGYGAPTLVWAVAVALPAVSVSV